MASQRISFDYVELPQLQTSFVRRLSAAFQRWRVHASQCAVLAQLDARMLQDMGVTESDVGRETRSLYWFP